MELLDSLRSYILVQNNREFLLFIFAAAAGAFSGLIWFTSRIRNWLEKKAAVTQSIYQLEDGDLDHYSPELVQKYVYAQYNYAVYKGEPNLGYMAIVYGGYATDSESASDMDIAIIVDKHLDNPDSLPDKRVHFDTDGFVELTDYPFLRFWRNLVIGKPHAINVVEDGRVLEAHRMNPLEFDYLKSMMKDLTYYPKYISKTLVDEIRVYEDLATRANKEEDAELLSSFAYLQSSCVVQKAWLYTMDEEVTWREIYPIGKPQHMIEFLLNIDTGLADTFTEIRDRYKQRVPLLSCEVMLKQMSAFRSVVSTTLEEGHDPADD